MKIERKSDSIHIDLAFKEVVDIMEDMVDHYDPIYPPFFLTLKTEILGYLRPLVLRCMVLFIQEQREHNRDMEYVASPHSWVMRLGHLRMDVLSDIEQENLVYVFEREFDFVDSFLRDTWGDVKRMKSIVYLQKLLGKDEDKKK